VTTHIICIIIRNHILQDEHRTSTKLQTCTDMCHSVTTEVVERQEMFVANVMYVPPVLFFPNGLFPKKLLSLSRSLHTVGRLATCALPCAITFQSPVIMVNCVRCQSKVDRMMGCQDMPFDFFRNGHHIGIGPPGSISF